MNCYLEGIEKVVRLRYTFASNNVFVTDNKRIGVYVMLNSREVNGLKEFLE